MAGWRGTKAHFFFFEEILAMHPITSNSFAGGKALVKRHVACILGFLPFFITLVIIPPRPSFCITSRSLAFEQPTTTCSSLSEFQRNDILASLIPPFGTWGYIWVIQIFSTFPIMTVCMALIIISFRASSKSRPVLRRRPFLTSSLVTAA